MKNIFAGEVQGTLANVMCSCCLPKMQHLTQMRQRKKNKRKIVFLCWSQKFRESSKLRLFPEQNNFRSNAPQLCELLHWSAGLSDCIVYWYWVYNILMYWVFLIHLTNFVIFPIQYNTVRKMIME